MNESTNPQETNSAPVSLAEEAITIPAETTANVTAEVKRQLQELTAAADIRATMDRLEPMISELSELIRTQQTEMTNMGTRLEEMISYLVEPDQTNPPKTESNSNNQNNEEGRERSTSENNRPKSLWETIL